MHDMHDCIWLANIIDHACSKAIHQHGSPPVHITYMPNISYIRKNRHAGYMQCLICDPYILLMPRVMSRRVRLAEDGPLYGGIACNCLMSELLQYVLGQWRVSLCVYQSIIGDQSWQ
jgi:hypothetical protein